MDMKNKIEINQSDMLDLLVDKVDFLLKEYRSLHEAFNYKGRGRTKTDPVKVAESYENFLKEEGDIKRILKFYDLFDDTKKEPIKKETTTKKKEEVKEDKKE